MRRGFHWFLIPAGGAAGVLLTLASCVSTETVAPSVDSIIARLPDRAASVESLELGRRIYLTKCAECHVAEPVGRYSAAQWRSILPRMNELTHLDAREAQAVADYIDAVLAAPSAASRLTHQSGG